MPFYSTVTGGRIEDTTVLDAGYWYRNIRETVLLEETVQTLAAADHRVFIEVGPHPVATTTVADILEAAGAPHPALLGTLRRNEGGPARFLLSLAELAVRGGHIDWADALGGPGERVDLPVYAFQSRRYWPEFAPPVTTHRDTDDAPFWEAVESGDLTTLASALELDEIAVSALAPALARYRGRAAGAATADSWRHRITWHPLGDPPLTP